jgi:signal transduction histidine kinase
MGDDVELTKAELLTELVDLRRQVDELARAKDEADTFAETVAHDLQNPVTLIMGVVEVLQKGYVNLSEDEIQHYLTLIMRNSQKMALMIEGLLWLGRLRNQEVDVEPLAMDEIVTESLLRLTWMIQKHRAEIVTPDRWPVALGHPLLLEEIWANLISNAIKYGGTPPHIVVGADAPRDGIVRFWVHDNGKGIPPSIQVRLFQMPRVFEKRIKGKGLGLVIVRRMVEKLKGEVGVESVPGEGSTFFFTLQAHTSVDCDDAVEES